MFKASIYFCNNTKNKSCCVYFIHSHPRTHTHTPPTLLHTHTHTHTHTHQHTHTHPHPHTPPHTHLHPHTHTPTHTHTHTHTQKLALSLKFYHIALPYTLKVGKQNGHLGAVFLARLFFMFSTVGSALEWSDF